MIHKFSLHREENHIIPRPIGEMTMLLSPSWRWEWDYLTSSAIRSGAPVLF